MRSLGLRKWLLRHRRSDWTGRSARRFPTSTTSRQADSEDGRQHDEQDNSRCHRLLYEAGAPNSHILARRPGLGSNRAIGRSSSFPEKPNLLITVRWLSGSRSLHSTWSRASFSATCASCKGEWPNRRVQALLDGGELRGIRRSLRRTNHLADVIEEGHARLGQCSRMTPERVREHPTAHASLVSPLWSRCVQEKPACVRSCMGHG